MKYFKFLAAIISAATLCSCGNTEESITETAYTTVETVETVETFSETISETTGTVTEKSVETRVTAEEKTAAESTSAAETTAFDPAEAMELCAENLLLTAESWVYNVGVRDETACYFLCILDDGTVYTMKYKTSETDGLEGNAFTDGLYSLDNSVWDLAEDVEAVGNIFSQMSREMLTAAFSAIDWDSDYYIRPDYEEVPAVAPEYDITVYLYPLRDGGKTAVLADSDGCRLDDEHAAEFLRLVGRSDVYREWIWFLKDFSRGD